MNIFTQLFGPKPETPPVNPPPGSNPNPESKQTTTLGTQQTAQTGANGVIPEQKEQSPMEPFKDIWNNVPNPNATKPGVFGEVDSAKLMQAAATVDFAKVISPEILAKISAGGTESQAAFAQALNSVSQTVYGQSALATTKIVEQALAKQADQFRESLPGLIRKHATFDSLRTKNPLITDPAIQPLAAALQAQLEMKNPNATTAEIEAQVNGYFEALSTKFSAPKKAEEKAKTTQGETDWDAFMSMPSN